MADPQAQAGLPWMNNPIVQIILGLMALGGFTFGGTAHMINRGGLSEQTIEIVQAAVARGVDEALNPTVEETLARFIDRVGEEHEDCVQMAGKQVNTTNQLLATLLCDLDRQYEYTKRQAR